MGLNKRMFKGITQSGFKKLLSTKLDATVHAHVPLLCVVVIFGPDDRRSSGHIYKCARIYSFFAALRFVIAENLQHAS